MKLYYLPVERYKNRWTEYVSGGFGMFAGAVHDANRNVELITLSPDETLREVKQGVVLDVGTRMYYGFWQVANLVKMIQAGEVTDDSTIYIEDFWLPGFEMIPYACHIAGVRPAVYAFCHAQSVDQNDFTYPMREWMRPMEQGWANWLTGIFVAADDLKEMLTLGHVAPLSKVHTTGTVMRRQTLVEKGILRYGGGKRKRTVVFASRPDPEKDPYFYIRVAKKMRDEDLTFLYLSGRKLPEEIIEACADAGVVVLDGISKIEYFEHLQQASVAFNCAKQDFIGYCQLDALAAGCPVLCPNYLTFPDLMQHDGRYLYEMGNVDDACSHIRAIVNETAGTLAGNTKVPEIYEYFGARFEDSVSRMLDIMFPH